MDHVADLVFFINPPYDPMIMDPYILDQRTFTKMGKNIRKVFCPCPPSSGQNPPKKTIPFPWEPRETIGTQGH